MLSMRLDPAARTLRPTQEPIPQPGSGQALIRVAACGVCRTDLHVVDQELAGGPRAVVPGHEVVGRVAGLGSNARRFAVGQRVGVPWLGHTCGVCVFCRGGRENLCDQPRFTGFDLDGGYAEYLVADEAYCLELPDSYSDLAAAPLLCAGLIGYRALSMAGDASRLGIYGFGAAAHIVAQIAVAQGSRVYAFTRRGDRQAQEFARSLRAVWTGGSDESPPEALEAAIIFAPVGELVPQALRHLVKGGSVICAGIHMSDIPSFPYSQLWGERHIRSVANLTRRDGAEFMALAAKVPIHTTVQPYALANANIALSDLREGRVRGAAVLTT
jgi:alcohol dehydrogenase, propanol-preferring